MREITADEAAVAVKRGAPLLKFCRRSSPHVVFAQCSSTALTYAGRRGRERSIEFSRVERVLKGRHTEVFRKRRERDAEDDLKSFSIAYADAARDAHVGLRVRERVKETRGCWESRI